MAIFTDKRELVRQGERVNPNWESNWFRRAGMATMGYKKTGEKNKVGEIISHAGPTTMSTLTNLGARAFAKDDTDTNEVIKGGTGDELALDAQKLANAFQVLKIIYAAGGFSGASGASGAASGATTGGEAAATGLGTGGEVLSGTATAGMNVVPTSATPPLSVGTAGMGTGTSQVTGLSTGLGDEMAGFAAGLTAADPTLGITTAASSPISPGSTVPDITGLGANISSSADANSALGSNMSSTPNELAQGTVGEGSSMFGTESMTQYDTSQMDGGQTSGALTPGEKVGNMMKKMYGSEEDMQKKVKQNLLSGIGGIQDERTQNIALDHNAWRESMEANGWRVGGDKAYDNMGNIMEEYERPSDKDENLAKAGNALKSVVAGNIVQTGTAKHKGARDTNEDYKDRAQEFRGQVWYNPNYLA